MVWAMFSDVFAAIQKNKIPDPSMLQKRFDFAMTKKMGVIKLPPPFWMQDPKINPRADHLFWAALLLKDRERIEMAQSVLAEELQEKTCRKSENRGECIQREMNKLIEEFLQQLPDNSFKQEFILDLKTIVPELMVSTMKVLK